MNDIFKAQKQICPRMNDISKVQKQICPRMNEWIFGQNESSGELLWEWAPPGNNIDIKEESLLESGWQELHIF